MERREQRPTERICIEFRDIDMKSQPESRNFNKNMNGIVKASPVDMVRGRIESYYKQCLNKGNECATLDHKLY